MLFSGIGRVYVETFGQRQKPDQAARVVALSVGEVGCHSEAFTDTW